MCTSVGMLWSGPAPHRQWGPALLLVLLAVPSARATALEDCMTNMTGAMVAASGHNFSALGDFEACKRLEGAKYCTLREVCAGLV